MLIRRWREYNNDRQLGRRVGSAERCSYPHFAGLLGIILAISASLSLSALLNVPFILEPGTVALAFLFSAAVGVIFGFVPAHKGDPIEVLRHE